MVNYWGLSGWKGFNYWFGISIIVVNCRPDVHGRPPPFSLFLFLTVWGKESHNNLTHWIFAVSLLSLSLTHNHIYYSLFFCFFFFLLGLFIYSNSNAFDFSFLIFNFLLTWVSRTFECLIWIKMCLKIQLKKDGKIITSRMLWWTK